MLGVDCSKFVTEIEIQKKKSSRSVHSGSVFEMYNRVIPLKLDIIDFLYQYNSI